MKPAGEVFEGIHEARGGAVNGVADGGNTTVANGIEATPAGTLAEVFDSGAHGFGVRTGEDEKLRLQPDHFFETQARPILLRFNDGFGAGQAQRVGDERLSANGDEGVAPDDE